ncbi:MAG TPA: 50S ribosomal protein L11 methyltransferase [Stellaceae bacterium]|nr:50S ribosomal protein L11 methyltransferase [Stellaceae bacterium]
MIDPTLFVRSNTEIKAPPLVPEIVLHLATEVTPIWQATEESLARFGTPPPFWAFAWAGGQALARYLLDHPETVAGREVLDIGSGSGIVAIAAAKAGARRVTAAEIDPFAAAAIALNAPLNGVTVRVETRDLLDRAAAGWGVALAGDICYEEPMSSRAMALLRRIAARGRLALLGDPGRAYLPRSGLVELARYEVATSRELEDREAREGVVWQVLPE